MQSTQSSLPLRDIHLPDSVSWWPPAPGYWLLLLTIALLMLAIWLIKKWLRKQKIKKVIALALSKIEQEYKESSDSQLLAQDLSVLLRRVCLVYFPGTGFESLTGIDWLAFLDSKVLVTPGFQSDIGKVLLTAPYARPGGLNGQALLVLCRLWINRVNKGK